MSKACHNSNVTLFADDTKIHFSSKVVGEAEYRINEWSSNNGVICNTKTTVSMVIARHRADKMARDVRTVLGDWILEQKRSFEYLGVMVDELVSWNSHKSCVASRVSPLNLRC